MQLFLVFLTALFVSTLSVAGLMRIANRLNLVDLPDSRKIHSRAVPRVGGVGMAVGAVVALWVWGEIDENVLNLLPAIFIVVTIGLWDDLSNLNYKVKLAGQLLAVLAVVLTGGLLITRLSVSDFGSLPYFFSLPLTILFLLGTTNAVNLSDGLDGLAAGLSLLSLACMVILAEPTEANSVLLVAVATIGATLGFLRHNTHPALVFMGDSGSLFLGFILGVLTIWLTQTSNKVITPEVMLLILGFPVLDTLRVMASRVTRGRSVFTADKEHFHHKLLELGLDHDEAVLAIYILQSLLVASGYLLRYESAWFIVGYYVLIFLAVLVFFPIAAKLRWRLESPRTSRVSLISGRVSHHVMRKWMEHFSDLLATCMIVSLLVLSSAVTEKLTAGMGYFALGMIGISVTSGLRTGPMRDWVARLCIYTCAIFIISVVENSDVWGASTWHTWAKYYFMCLVLLIAMGIHYSAKAYFSVTPSDFLVMFVLLVAASLPAFEQTRAARIAVESSILLYGAELLLSKRGKSGVALLGGAVTSFVIVAARALL